MVTCPVAAIGVLFTLEVGFQTKISIELGVVLFTPAVTQRLRGTPLPDSSEATTLFTVLKPVGMVRLPVTPFNPLVVANDPPNAGALTAVALSEACASNKRGRCLSSSVARCSGGRRSNVGGRKVKRLGIGFSSERTLDAVAKQPKPWLDANLKIRLIYSKARLAIERELIQQPFVGVKLHVELLALSACRGKRIGLCHFASPRVKDHRERDRCSRADRNISVPAVYEAGELEAG